LLDIVGRYQCVADEYSHQDKSYDSPRNHLDHRRNNQQNPLDSLL
jgi:hypothetical protein